MTARSLHRQDLDPPVVLDWVLVLLGALLAWLCWPSSLLH